MTIATIIPITGSILLLCNNELLNDLLNLDHSSFVILNHKLNQNFICVLSPFVKVLTSNG